MKDGRCQVCEKVSWGMGGMVQCTRECKGYVYAKCDLSKKEKVSYSVKKDTSKLESKEEALIAAMKEAQS